jgi:arylsulfatase A-like enzyme
MIARTLAILLVFACCLQVSGDEPETKTTPQPNILWLSAEDISAHLGCYGDPHAITPNLDLLAKRGIHYTNAYTTAGVCAPCRSGIITGVYQTSLGTHHMRCEAKLPEFIKPFPTYLREVGYYCTNNSKQDYQFKTPAGTWDDSSGKAHWRNRKEKDQPFFAVFNYTGCHESGIASAGKYKSVTSKLTEEQRQDAAALTTLPPYYPDTPTAREDWKRNYELITAMDAWAGDLLDQLKEDGLAENTIVFFWSDHGVGLPRAKRWLYDSGTHIPLIVHVPKSLHAEYQTHADSFTGAVSDELISSIDFAPTVLSLAGVTPPAYIQGSAFLGEKLGPERNYVYGARDRMDERYDIIRMVRDKRFKYIRNYEPLKTYYHYMNTPEKGATMNELRKLHDTGELNPVAEKYFSATKPVEELYDTVADPHEIHNLAADPKYAEDLQRMRKVHLKWVQDTKDVGLIPEPIIAAREKTVGDRYSLLRQGDGDAYNAKLGEIAAAASDGKAALPKLVAALDSDDDAIRYWGATGIGNVGRTAKETAESKLLTILKDESPTVRIAAARALCNMGNPEPALPILTKELLEGEQWERLQAAIVLDEIDAAAKPAIPALKKALASQKGFLAGGKYRVRVVNRALNELLGTKNSVP